jgi:hypothetical protein
MEETIINSKGREEKKRGRKRNDRVVSMVKNKGQDKFFIDLSNDKEVWEVINKLLTEANNKSYGRVINLRDLVIHAVPKLNSKDIEKIQDQSLTEMERVKKLLDEHNEKNKTTLTLGEFLVKKLNI